VLDLVVDDEGDDLDEAERDVRDDVISRSLSSLKPAFSTKSRCASTAFTIGGKGSVIGFAWCRPDGSNAQGAALSSSSMLPGKCTPTTAPVREASRAIDSAALASVRRATARKAH
jgi:hypothetical protein